MLYDEQTVLAGIVLYNPDCRRLKENIESLIGQVDGFVLVDNGSDHIDLIQDALCQYENVEWIKLNKNYGIAYALNRLLYYANKRNVRWVLTMDQDSVAYEGLIERYKRYRNQENVAMIACGVIDRNTADQNHRDMRTRTVEVEKCITSGCFTNVEACLAVGGFDNALFIDYVDFEMCLRLRLKGYKILNIGYTGLLSEVGYAKRVKIFGKDLVFNGNPVEVYQELPFRVYYFFRNTTYMVRKYKNACKGYTSCFHILWRALLVVLYETPKIQKIKMICRGVWDGIRIEIK